MGQHDTDPFVNLLSRLLVVTVRDARQRRDEKLRREAWSFLWSAAPSIAERLMIEEGIEPMKTTNEAPTTLAEAEDIVRLWQAKLTKAQSAVVAYEQQIGQLALSGGASDAPRELQRLRDEVSIASAALAAAQAQREEVKRAERIARVERLRKEAAEADKLADEAATIYNELAPKAAAAQSEMWHHSRRAEMLKRSIEDAERKLKEAVR